MKTSRIRDRGTDAHGNATDPFETRPADKLGEDRGVIAGPGADLDDVLSRHRGEDVEQAHVQPGFAVVEYARRVDGDTGVLVDVDRIVVGSVAILLLAPHHYLPWARTEERLARNGEGARAPLRTPAMSAMVSA